jgi:hypothetical protein
VFNGARHSAFRPENELNLGRNKERLTAAQKVESSTDRDIPVAKRHFNGADPTPTDLFALSVRWVSDRRTYLWPNFLQKWPICRYF